LSKLEFSQSFNDGVMITNLSFSLSRSKITRETRLSIVCLFIPLLLSSFVHLWNPIGFPAVFVDEGHYMRRALQVLNGHGPQESLEVYDYPYDHPYFGQIILAVLLKIVGYPDSVYSISSSSSDAPEEMISTVERLHLVPRVLMGLLAVFDTFLIYKIAERRYNKKTAFFSSVIFAVMPITWPLRMIVLESLLLPFLLSSLLFAVYLRDSKQKKVYRRENVIRNNKKVIAFVLISGVFLGLAVFTKVSIVSIIPAIGYVIYVNTKSLRLFFLWIIPVLAIPLIWPAYAFSISQFNSWFEGVVYQTEREDTTFLDFLKKISNIDPLFLILGFVAIIFAEIKRDYMILLWTISYLVFIAIFGANVRHFHFIVLTPILSIASARFIIYLSDKISSRYNSNRIQTISLGVIASSMLAFGFVSTLSLITINLNSTYFELYAAIIEDLPQADAREESNNIGKVTMLGHDNIRNYVWIPKYVMGKDHYSKDVHPPRFLREPIKTDNVLLIIDRKLSRDILDQNKNGRDMIEIRSIYENSYIVAEFKQRWPYDRNIYPYTSLRENFGIGNTVYLMTNY
jgi:Dolichyl-phosphate-mannose-protein mannosyltransferase